jgi:hypothetical protein
MKRVVFIVLEAAIFCSCATAPDVMDDEEFLELVKTGSPKEVEKALQNGANANARDEYGSTPLLYAASHSEYPEVIQLLIDAGADVHAKNEWDASVFYLIQLNEALVDSDAYWNLYKLKDK